MFSQRCPTMTCHLRRPAERLPLGLRALLTVLTALCLTATLWPATAGAQALPAASGAASGNFETVPTTWTWSGASGALSSIATAQAGDASNHYLSTTYHALAGTSLAALDAHETITSPTFTWSQATPQAVSFTMDLSDNLGSLVGLNSGAKVSAALLNTTTNTTTALESTSLIQNSNGFMTLATSAPPALLVNGDSYRLVVTESITPLVAVVGQATINLDNVALDVTPAQPPAPAFAAGSAVISQITSSSAQADATIDPGSSDTTVSVRYGTTTAYGAQVQESIPANSGPTAVTLPISGLSPSTTYYAEIVATSAAGTSTISYQPFTTTSQPSGATAPAVSASMLDATPGERDATLGATIDTGGQNPTSYYVRYGTTTAYGSTTSPQTLPAGTTGGQPVSVDITGLTPGTAYHAQLVATGPGGTTDGSDVAFTTGALTPPTGTAPTFTNASTAGTAVTVATTVNPGEDDTQVSVSYGPTTAYGTTTPTQTVTAGSGATGVQFPITGLIAGMTYDFAVTVTSADGTHTYTATDTPMASPTPPVGATSLTASGEQTATLMSSINPNGASATYHLNYGTSPTSLTSSTTTQTIDAGTTGTQALSASLTGLAPGTTYDVQFVATVNGSGTSQGSVFQFTTAAATPPVIDASSVTDVAPTSANLVTTVDPGDAATTVYAEYGPTSGYGSETAPVTIPAGSGPTTITLPLAGLTQGTGYHVRLISTNADATAPGPDLTFTTDGTAPTPVIASAPAPGSPTTPASGSTTTTAPGPTAPIASGPTAPTASAGPSCVAAYVSAPARSLTALRLPAGGDVTAAHGLTIRLAARSARHGGARYTINGGPRTQMGRRLTLHLAQLRIGRRTRVTVTLPRSGHRRSTKVRLSIAVLPCGAQLSARRLSGHRVAITARSALAVRRVSLVIPAGWGAPRSLQLLTVGGVRSLAIVGSGAHLRVVRGGGIRVTRKGTRVRLTGLSARTTTGVRLIFRTGHATGSVSARVFGARGPAQTTRTVLGLPR